MNVETVAISALTPDPRNARKHDQRNIAAIAASLREFGQRKPIVVTHEGTVIAGNGTLEAAKELGWETISIARAPQEWDDNTVRAYALADNQSAALAEWDDSILNDTLIELAQEGWDIAELGFDAVPEPPSPEKPKDDAVPEPPENPVSRLGDLWIIGPHRILCGDSSDQSALDRLTKDLIIGCVLTDPPYGIDLDTDYSVGGGKTYKKVANDNQPFDASFLRSYFDGIKEQYWWGANYYYRTLTDRDLSGSWLVWDKRTEATDVVVGSGFELCWSNTKHKQDLLRYHWTNFTSHVNAGHKRIHPTEKPVDMLIEIMDRWVPKRAVVIDPFAGSGSTLIAASKSDRIGIGIEIDPGYVDLIVKRLEIETGATAELAPRG
jgi:ParB-like chromosome segregation protein Spo0J